jgi:[ribosomal protein S18]-alanine N-acetyltransferase
MQKTESDENLNITLAKKEDAQWIDAIIKIEFSYIDLNKGKIIEKIKDSNFNILIARQGNIQVGFCETELFLLKKEARLNAIFVEDAWRDQGIGKTLIAQTINDCKHKRIQKIFLLVKEENISAKKLYEKTNFEFAGMHDKIIDASNIEIWEQKI